MTGTALITGAAVRIGAAIARDLSAHGWKVAIHANRSRDAAETLATELGARDGRAAVVIGDLGDAERLEGIVADAAAALGPLTLLVNNAALFDRDEMGELDRRTWDRQLAVNLAAPVFLAQAFASQLPDGAEGNIVSIIDQRVWKPTPLFFSYQIAKSGLWVATQTMAQALAPRIRVNAIAPGPSLKSARQAEEHFQTQVMGVPLQRGPDLAEFGRTVRYFVESRSVTGQMIALDGGQHLAWQTPEITGVEE